MFYPSKRVDIAHSRNWYITVRIGVLICLNESCAALVQYVSGTRALQKHHFERMLSLGTGGLKRCLATQCQRCQTPDSINMLSGFSGNFKRHVACSAETTQGSRCLSTRYMAIRFHMPGSPWALCRLPPRLHSSFEEECLAILGHTWC